MQATEPTKIDKQEIKANSVLLDNEWLETNGLGSYSASTLLNCHTRKYHGLLVANQKTDRFVILSKFDEVLEYTDPGSQSSSDFYLSYHYYDPGVYVPMSAENILAFDFSHDRHPKWVFKHPDFSLTKEMQMIHGEDTVLIKYQIESDKDVRVKLKLRPLLAYRNFHQLSKENNCANFDVLELKDGISTCLYQDMPSLFIQANKSSKFQPSKLWYQNFLYSQEVLRGYPAKEDLASPGILELDLASGEELFLSLSLEEQNRPFNILWSSEMQRREALISHHEDKGFIFFAKKLGLDPIQQLREKLDLASDQFVIKTSDANYSVIAGYHWFGEWGRDTMISLPGLLMGKDPEFKFRRIIKHFLNHKQQGLIPNIIGASSCYNSVDGSLWLFWAVQQFSKYQRDFSWIKYGFWSDLKDIFEHLSQSKAPHVRCLDNGLLESGTAEDSMSWMDACLDGKSVIPRYGCLVEINALWYNAVCFMIELGKSFGDSIIMESANRIKLKIQESFSKTFYIREGAYLGDYYRDGVLNKQIRPNQLFAVSMPYSAITHEQAQSIIQMVEDKLLTPYGLRTLDRDDPDYKGTYEGDVKERDKAYHNGTVWPWLLGAYGDALLKTEDKVKAQKKIRNVLKCFCDHMDEFGINSVSEIFDGDSPYIPRGCIAQAWSVAELRRLALSIS